MKVLNSQTSANWETVLVKLNGYLLQLPVFPLRARGQSYSATPQAAFWGDPDNMEKLWFIVRIGRDGNGTTFVPYAFVDPNTPHGAKDIEAMYVAEQRAFEELPVEKEVRQLRKENEQLRRKRKERLR